MEERSLRKYFWSAYVHVATTWRDLFNRGRLHFSRGEEEKTGIYSKVYFYLDKYIVTTHGCIIRLVYSDMIKGYSLISKLSLTSQDCMLDAFTVLN